MYLFVYLFACMPVSRSVYIPVSSSLPASNACLSAQTVRQLASIKTPETT